MQGILKQEKKCPKCKSLNTLTLGSKEIFIHCKFFDPGTNNYHEDKSESYPYVEYN